MIATSPAMTSSAGGTTDSSLLEPTTPHGEARKSRRKSGRGGGGGSGGGGGGGGGGRDKAKDKDKDMAKEKSKYDSVSLMTTSMDSILRTNAMVSIEILYLYLSFI